MLLLRYLLLVLWELPIQSEKNRIPTTERAELAHLGSSSCIYRGNLLFTCITGGEFQAYYFTAGEDKRFEGGVSPIRCPVLGASTYWRVCKNQVQKRHRASDYLYCKQVTNMQRDDFLELAHCPLIWTAALLRGVISLS